MSSTLYISAANYDRRHLENSKIGLENSLIFFFLHKSGNPVLFGCRDGGKKCQYVRIKERNCSVQSLNQTTTRLGPELLYAISKQIMLFHSDWRSVCREFFNIYLFVIDVLLLLLLMMMLTDSEWSGRTQYIRRLFCRHIDWHISRMSIWTLSPFVI